MKAFFQNRVVAIVITALVTVGCLAYGWTRKPASVPSPSYGDWVYDGAEVLSSSTEFTVEDFNKSWNSAYGSVMAVATVDSTKGWELEDYSATLGSNWGLRANDALLLLDVGARQYWMSTGERLENSVGYDTLYDMFQEHFVPDFRSRDYDAAVLNICSAMDSCYAQAYGGSTGGTIATYTPYYDAGSESTGRVNLVSLVIVLVLLFLIFSAIDKSRYRRWATNGRSGYNSASFIPLLFWHRPGGSWFRSMEDRYLGGGPGYRNGGSDFRSGSYHNNAAYRSSSGSYRPPNRSAGSSYRSGGFGSGSYRGGSSYRGSGFGGSAGGGSRGGRGFGGK